MGQKVNPIALRLGYIRGWESNWFGGKDFASKLIEDEKIRDYIDKRLDFKAGVAKVTIERSLNRVTLSIHTVKPGIIIGRQGAEVDKIKAELKRLTNKEIQINIVEIKADEAKLNARLLALTIANKIEGRGSYKRAIKSTLEEAVRINCKGIKIQISGRLGGAEMARTEIFKEGSIPLHTMRADIDYAFVEANTVYGKIGIKLWVFKGEIYERKDLYAHFGRKKRDDSRPKDNKNRERDGKKTNRKRNPNQRRRQTNRQSKPKKSQS